jgi:hypothetical protein
MPKRKSRFNIEFQTKSLCFKAERSESETECIASKTFMSVPNRGSYDWEAHINTARHKNQIESCHNTPKVSEFLIKQNSKTEERVIAAVGELLCHNVKHYLTNRYIDRTSILIHIF